MLNRIIKLLFMSFIILQPIFDIYMCLFDEYIQIAGMSLATLLRLAIAFVMTALVMISTRKTKVTLFFSIYAFSIIVYAIIHHFNAISFSVQLPVAEYNPIQELFYLIRICIPPALIYVIYNIKPTYKDMKIVLLSVSGIMSSVIIVSNLLKVGHVAYVLEKRVIEDNMISWFTGTDTNWVLLTCRGLFQWTNQISAVMLIILPFLVCTALNEKKAWYWVFPFTHMIAMINLGTRIATVGGLLVLFATLFVYILEKIIQKSEFKKQLKNVVCFALSTILVLLLFMFSPVIRRSQEAPLFEDLVAPNLSSSQLGQPAESEITSSKKTETSSDIETSPDMEAPSDSEMLPEEKEKTLKIEYIEKNIPTAKINGLYIYTAYPYTQDVDFWYHIIKDVPENERSGNRNMRSYMIDRILELDNRFSNYIWGISYTRSSSFVWPERDIETHFDSLGIVGCILFIGPYFAGMLTGLWFFFKRLKENLKLSRVIYLICLFLGLVNAYFSGHVMNEIFPFVFLALMAGMAISNNLNVTEESL